MTDYQWALFFWCFPRLETVDLKFADISDGQLRHLAGLRHLRELDLSWTRITGEGLRHLGRLPKLRKLSLQHVDEKGARAIAELAGLQELSGDLEDTSMGPLTELPHLEFLHVANLPWGERRLSDAGLQCVGAFRALKWITLEHTDVSDLGVKYLTSVPGLEGCEIICGRLTDESMRTLAESQTARRLKSLTLVGMDRITDRGIGMLAGSPIAEGLESLSLGQMDKITDEAIPHLGKLRNLEYLAVHNTGISRQGIRRLGAVLPRTTVSFGDELGMIQLGPPPALRSERRAIAPKWVIW